MKNIFLALLTITMVATAASSQTPFYDINTIEQIEIKFQQSNWRTVLANNWRAKIYIRAEVIINGVSFKDAGVRYRGNSTYFALPRGKEDKRPFKIALDEFVDQDYQGYETINLNNNLYDPTLVREVLGYEFMRKYVPAPKCNYAKLKINGQDFGIFINTQQINKELLEQWWEDEDGNRYRGEPSNFFQANDTALTWLGLSMTPYLSAYQLKTEQTIFPWSDLVTTCDVLNNTPATQRRQALPRAIDIDNALRFLAVGNVVLWLDSYLGRYVHNFYMYSDPTHGRMSFIPWDLNSCFGGYADTLTLPSMKVIGPFWRENESGRPRPLFKNIVADPRWRARYLAYYRAMVRNYGWAKLLPRITALQNFIRTEIQNDPKRIYSFAWFTQCLTQDINVTSTRQLLSLKGAIDDRERFLVTHTEVTKVGPTLSALGHTPARPTPNDKVWVNVTATGATPTTVTLLYRHRGPFIETPMFDDGQHNDGLANDGVFGASIPPAPPLALIEYFVTANTDLTQGGAMTVAPENGSLSPPAYRVAANPTPGTLFISEFVAKNDTGIQDEQNEHEDWFELANTSNQPADVSGFYATDNVGNPTKWQLPNGTVIGPGQTLLIWADNEPAEGPLHATFKLSAGGEDLALFARDGVTLIDAIQFGPQTADVSTGRMDGHPHVLATFRAPTPRALNRPSPCGHLAYGSLDAARDALALAAAGAPSLNAVVQFSVSGAPANTAGVLALASAPLSIPLPGSGSLLVDLSGIAPFPIMTNTAGIAQQAIRIPNVAALRGLTVYLQAFVRNGASGGFSNAVATRICP